MSNAKRHDAAQRADAIATAWGKLAPDAEFAGMTLTDYVKATKGSTQGRQEKKTLKTQLSGQRNLIVTSDAETRKLNKKVIGAIIGHPDFGDDCPLYAGVGLVPASERASGLTKKNGNGNGNGHPQPPA